MTMFNPCHPGLVVFDLLIENEDGNTINSVAEAAKLLNCHRSSLNYLVNGKRALSPVMALALEDAGFGDAQSWMNMQTAYELFQLRSERAA